MTSRWLGDNRVSDADKQTWIKEGYVVLRSAFADAAVDQYNATVAAARRELPSDGKDEAGFGNRIGHLHQKENSLLELAGNKQILNFLGWALDDDPMVFASLNFERGTEQAAHIDAIFFWPAPCYAMAGVWIALEDIHPDAGPLFYVPGSHQWPFIDSGHAMRGRPELAAEREHARRTNPMADEFADLSGRIGLAWTEEFYRLKAEKNVDEIALPIRKGDAVVWHSLLAHGGSPRTNPALSRRSVVFHYIGQRTRLFSDRQFMMHSIDEISSLPPEKPKIRKYKHVAYMRYPHFVTFGVNDAAQVHPLE